MRLTRLQVTNYRSLFGERLDLELGPGMNAVIGPNNCGKSNLLRALALALQPDATFDRGVDLPPLGPATRSRVVCIFEMGSSGPEETLLNRVRDAERALSGSERTYADDRQVRFAVSASGTGRKEFFVARGAGTKQPETTEQHELARKAAQQLRSACRFVYVRSGESLETLLRGRFREVLRTVLEEAQRPEYERAESARGDFIHAIRYELLSALETQVVDQVQQLFPEIQTVEMEPEVSSIASALLDVDVQLADVVKGGLADKGTGLRGAVLVAMLRYLAHHGRRSVVVALEEPESFLHPAAQEALRNDLEHLAGEQDVSLIVTTHSPFIPSRLAPARLFAFSKDAEGRTTLAGTAEGDAPRMQLVLSLFRSAAQPRLLERATQADASAIIVVEGETDETYLRTAIRLLGRDHEFQQVQFVPAEGAKRAVRRALVIKDELPEVPIVVVLDDDPDGRRAYERLTGDFGFQGNRDVLYYSGVFPSRPNEPHVVEAEDLFKTSFIQHFLDSGPSGEFTALSHRSPLWGADWSDEIHFDLTEAAKQRLARWVETRCRRTHRLRWAEVGVV
ncbi:MAG: ATP-dependent nuclease, partial [Acidimicrobiales bacterium]